MYGSFYSSPYGQPQSQGQATNNPPPPPQMPAYTGIAPSFQQYPGQQPPPPPPPPSAPSGPGMSYLPPQPTGYPLAPQPTGFQPPQGPPQQQRGGSLAPAPTGYGMSTPQQSLTPQYTAVPQQQQAQQQRLQPQPTSFAPPASAPPSAGGGGQTSSDIARSFAAAPSNQPSTPQKNHVTIPTQRLSFITATDQTKFEQLFRSAVGDGQALEGEKAKDLLLRSRLPGHDLAKIWVLADTTKSGRLLFPEFALAMYLCNLRLTNRDLPTKLPERIANEVSSMVDIISFSVPDSAPPPTTASLPTNVPDFSTNTNTAPAQPSNTALLSSLAPQPTGFFNQQQQPPQQQQTPSVPSIVAPQATGFPGAAANQSAMRPQQTGFLNPQPTAYSGPATGAAGGNIPPVPPIPSSFTGAPGNLAAQPTGMAPLATQPTGMPGQWGFVNAPASGLPNIEALKQQLMPQPGREGGYTTQGLSGNATVPWAVTKDEKKIYDDLFRAWDGFNKGFIGGDVAIEIMGQSGLPREDLERIWTLSDPNNRGKLNMDEFAVAMHLIYRRLNGYPVPARLPPELVPPSTRHLNDSIGQVKSLLTQDADSRKSSGAFLQPQKTGVSYLKDHSFRGTSGTSMPAHWGRKDATMFKNDDDAVPYRSSARRRGGGRSLSPNPEAQQQQRPVDVDEMSVEQLKKKIHETKIMLDAADFQDENAAEDEEAMNRRDRREAEGIMERIRRVQENIDNDPKAALRNTDSSAEKRALRRQLQTVQDQLPQLASDVRKTEKLIAEAKMEIFRLKDAKAHPNAMSIVGTGPNGTVTESDRIKARARARMQARAAELAGKPAPTLEDEGDAQRRIDEESVAVNAERDRNESMSRDVEESVKEFSRALEDGLKDVSESSTKEHERRRWEEALGVEDVIRDFIYDLQRSSRITRTRPTTADTRGYDRPSSAYERERQPSFGSPSRPSAYESPSRSMASTPTSAGASPSPHDRVLSAKERAQKRIQERMAAAGLRSGIDAGETLLQRQEREKREREERLKRAEEEDRKREEERQARLAKEGSVSSPAPAATAAPAAQPEQPAAPVPKKAAPPPPPQKREERVAEREAEQASIRAEQSAQEAERERLEAEARRQEEEIAREREAAEARLKALEEQVKQGKLRKQEEKRRKQQAAAEAKEKEERLARQRKEIEEAAERERKLRAQLESLDVSDESSDEDEWGEPKPKQEPEQPAPEPPKEPSPTSPPPPPPAPAPAPPAPATPVIREPSPEPEPAAPAPPPPAPAPAPAPDAESKNPFFRHSQQYAAAPAAAPAPAPAPAPAAPAAPEPPSQPQLASTNPFHNLSRNEAAAPRPRVEKHDSDDDWSNAGSDEESEDEDDHPGGGSAKQLASLLFSTMAPPRPLSAMEGSKTPTPTQEQPPAVPAVPAAVASPPPPDAGLPGAFPEPAADAGEAPSAPPPPPPMPPFGAPAAPPPPPPPPAPAPAAPGAPPPPPPPPPPAGAPAPRPAMPAGAPDRGALLADIQAGKGLRKVQTKDMSQASVAGRVLD